MKLSVITVLSAAALTGCGWFDRKIVANVAGYSKTCVDGVTYLQFPSGVTPQYTVNGQLIACK